MDAASTKKKSPGTWAWIAASASMAALIGVSLFAWQLSSQKEAAQDRADRLQSLVQSLKTQKANLKGSEQSLQSLFSSADAHVVGLEGQVIWDKSHLLDCWTVIARVVPKGTMPPTLEPLRRAARPTGSLADLITRCASDAVP